MLTAVKMRLYPTKEQKRLLRINFGCARYVWNDALAATRDAYMTTGKGLRWSELSSRLPKMKRDMTWLAESDAQVLQQSLANLAAAFEGFFHKRARYPKFKSRHGKQSIRFPQNVKIIDNRLKLSKIGKICCVIHRPIDGLIKSATISLDTDGRYYASVLVEDGVLIPEVSTDGKILGIDLGITHLAITSDGSKYNNPRHLSRATRNLRRKQQSLSRKRKGSKSRNKARLLVARAHSKIARCRADFIHKLSRRLVDENQVIAFEDLNVKGMLANHKVAKSIGDAGWYMLRSFCTYKAARLGKCVVIVDRWFPSSRTCYSCGHVVERLDLSIRSWVCSKCSEHHDRDVNAAKNIRDEAWRMIMAGRTPAAATGGCVSQDIRATLLIAAANESRNP